MIIPTTGNDLKNKHFFWIEIMKEYVYKVKLHYKNSYSSNKGQTL